MYKVGNLLTSGWVGRTRDNYSKQRPDIAKLFTHPWSVNIGKRAIFPIKLLSFYQKWSDQHKFCIESKGQISSLILAFKMSIALTKIL